MEPNLNYKIGYVSQLYAKDVIINWQILACWQKQLQRQSHVVTIMKKVQFSGIKAEVKLYWQKDSFLIWVVSTKSTNTLQNTPVNSQKELKDF